MIDASYWIKSLHLKPHPEGGYYSEVYRSSEIVENSDQKQRNLFTSIFYLIKSGQKSSFHQIKSDEIWYFHFGSAFKMHIFLPDGSYKQINIGTSLENYDNMQYLVPAKSIFGGFTNTPNSYLLVSCMVSPGFDFNDFKIFSSQELINSFPEYKNIIKLLT